MSRINELVSAIARTTAIVTGYYEEQGLPQPSYDIEGPSEVSIPSDKPSVSNAHVAALGATAKLYNLLLGPKGMLMSQNVYFRTLIPRFLTYNILMRSALTTSASTEFIASTSIKHFPLAPKLPLRRYRK